MKDYTIISDGDFQKARNSIKKAREQKTGSLIVFTGSDDELNRKILEKEKIDIFLPLLSRRKDRVKQRDSGFNHVLAKIAYKKGILIGINLDEILNNDKKEKTKIIARLKQNIEICKRNKLKMIFLNNKKQKDKYDLKALGLVLGMPTSMPTDF